MRNLVALLTAGATLLEPIPSGGATVQELGDAVVELVDWLKATTLSADELDKGPDKKPAQARSFDELQEIKKRLEAGASGAVADERPTWERARSVWLDVGDETLPLDQLALSMAPILWFSPDEPLLKGWQFMPTSVPCPGGVPAERPVVYYSLTIPSSFLTDDKKALALEWLRRTQADRLRKNPETLEVRFHFYYPTERGFCEHEHDIETVVFRARLGVQDSSSRVGVDPVLELRLVRVAAEAHGFNNILQVAGDDSDKAPDTRFPVTILVEEGKHGNCPDRNGDGIYTPGYDVNERVKDAWGLRDAFGSGHNTTRFEGDQAKPRSAHGQHADRAEANCRGPYRVGPPLSESHPLRSGYDGSCGSSWAPYELRPVDTVELNTCVVRERPPWWRRGCWLDLKDRMTDLGFGKPPGTTKLKLGSPWWQRSELSFFHSSGRGLSLSGALLRRAGVWFLPRFSLSSRLEREHLSDVVKTDPKQDVDFVDRPFDVWAADLRITPSIHTLLNGYVGVGFERASRTDLEGGLPHPKVREDTAVEAGVQIRWWKIVGRVGVRAALSRALELDRERLVFEIGLFFAPRT